VAVQLVLYNLTTKGRSADAGRGWSPAGIVRDVHHKGRQKVLLDAHTSCELADKPIRESRCTCADKPIGESELSCASASPNVQVGASRGRSPVVYGL
jgi:hypothetical protein